MRNICKTNRPPIPDTWGSENASPTRSHELISDNKSTIFEPTQLSNQDELVCCSNDFSPIEEYLQMTERLIKSKSLSPSEIDILKNLYAHYESIRSYGRAVENTDFDPSRRTSGRKDEVVDVTDHAIGVEVPSTSRESNTTKLIKFDKGVRRSLLEVEEQLIKLETVEDPDAKAICNPNSFNIDNVFSDFSFKSAGSETRLEQMIKDWVKKRTTGFWTNSGEGRQSVARRVENQPDSLAERAGASREGGQSTSVS